MADFYLSPAGNDSGSGTLADPWLTINKATLAGGTVHMAPGFYLPATKTAKLPLALIADDQDVVVAPPKVGPWTQVSLGCYTVWHATWTIVGTIRSAAWAPDAEHWADAQRIPPWWPSAPLWDTPTKWAASVLNTGNTHTRWGIYSSGADVYLIPPFDETWADPNNVAIWASSNGRGLNIDGPDVQVEGVSFLANYRGLELQSHAQRTQVLNCHTLINQHGIGIVASTDAQGVTTYGADHLIDGCLFEDNGTYQLPGETRDPRQWMAWNCVKAVSLDYGVKNPSGVPVLGKQPHLAAEAGGIMRQGGSLNTLVRGCTFKGTFDGDGHFSNNLQFDNRIDTNLRFEHCHYENITDDASDDSRWQNGVTYTDCTYTNVGVVLSPTNFSGAVTLSNCRGWIIGDQVRIADGFGNKPPGMIVKYGDYAVGYSQGAVSIEDSVFWSTTPTTKGISPDGGGGAVKPIIRLVRSTLRIGGRPAINYSGPAADLSIEDSTISTDAINPITAPYAITVLPTAEVDARFYEPAQGNFEDTSMIAELQAQLAALQVELDRLIALIRAKQEADLALEHAFDEAA